MKKLFYILSITLIFAVSSCADDFLDTEPSYSLNEKNSIDTYAKAQAAIGGIYETLISDHYSGGYCVSFASRAGFVRWSSADYNMAYSQENQTTSTILYRWTAYYDSMNAANFAISGISQLSDLQVSSEEREALLAEARCLRAFINIRLFWNYGHWWSNDDNNPNGLLYRDEPVALENVEKARITVGESYQKIYDDLDYAIEHLGSFTNNRYVSKEFAKVLKAKILLIRGGFNDTTEDLNEALTLVNDVLNSSVAGFSMQEDLAQVYQDSWDSEENLLSGYIEDDANRVYNASFYYSFVICQYYGTSLPLYTGQTLTAGLNYGVDWFHADPRWDVVTGESRAAIWWDSSTKHTWTKVTRLSQYAGIQAGDNMYNTYFFRYPELYIMKSELLARTGASITEAIAPINTMRSIRTNPVLPSLNPTTEQDLMDTIFKEYFFETFLENGSSYFASLRFKNSAGDPWMVAMKDGTPIDLEHLCYPIPSLEMEYNTLMTQNTGLE